MIKQRQVIESRAAQSQANQQGAAQNNGIMKVEEQGMSSTAPAVNAESQSPSSNQQKQDWEYVDEIVSILKTAYPLLALTLETMVDQFSTKFKSTPEEDIYRFTVMLLQDAMAVSHIVMAGLNN